MSLIQSQCYRQLELERITLSGRLRSLMQVSSTSQQDPDVELARHQMQVKLHRIQDAQARLDTGQFGLCQSCCQPISAERLLAMPYTELCIDCQRQVERRLCRPRHLPV